jgi:hypothetical protein
MKRDHPVALSVGAALLAGALVLGAYFLLRGRDHKAPAPAVQVVKSAARPSGMAIPGNPPPPPGNQPSVKPELPPALRNNAAPPLLPDNLPNQEELREQFTMLRRFLELPPDKLARIRESIERIEKMPPERKKMMLECIHRVNATPAAPRDEGDVFSETPVEIRVKVSVLLDNLTPQERAGIIEKTSKMTSTERNAFFEGMVAGSLSAETNLPSPWKSPNAVPFGSSK